LIHPGEENLFDPGEIMSLDSEEKLIHSGEKNFFYPGEGM
jgi:hypothetical protein